MNREIKFRVWDIDNNKYLKEERKFHFYLNADGTLMISTGWNDEKLPCDYEIADPEKYIIEQYTGFKDSGNTGKEIYHNDIFPKGGLVEWVWGGWHVKFPTYFISLYEYIYNDIHRKVIGNIHENKELLQERKQHGN